MLVSTNKEGGGGHLNIYQVDPGQAVLCFMMSRNWLETESRDQKMSGWIISGTSIKHSKAMPWKPQQSNLSSSVRPWLVPLQVQYTHTAHARNADVKIGMVNTWFEFLWSHHMSPCSQTHTNTYTEKKRERIRAIMRFVRQFKTYFVIHWNKYRGKPCLGKLKCNNLIYTGIWYYSTSYSQIMSL